MDKIKVNISYSTYNRLLYDYQLYYAEEDAPRFNGFICRIISNMYAEKERKRILYNEMLNDSGFKNANISYRESLVSRLLQTRDINDPFPLDCPLSIRPSSEYEPSFVQIVQNELSDMSLSSYLRLLLEEFLLLPSFEKEILLHKNSYDLATKAIKEKRMLRINLNGTPYYFRPYAFAINAAQSFVHLVGLEGQEGSQVSSVELYALHKHVVLTNKHFSFSKDEIASIEGKKSQTGGFVGDEIEAYVCLDQDGFAALKKSYFQRPYYEVDDERTNSKNIYVRLYGAYQQIKKCVFGLGEHAFVIRPKEISSELRSEYAAASNHYDKKLK